MNSCAGLFVGAGGGQPLPKVPWMSQTPFPPSIPNLDDIEVPGPIVAQSPSPPLGLSCWFPPPGLGEEPESVPEGTNAMLEFNRNSIAIAPSSHVPFAPPGLEDHRAPPMPTSPMPVLLGRTQQNFGHEESTRRGKKASSPSNKFAASPPPHQPSPLQPNKAKSESHQYLEGYNNPAKDYIDTIHSNEQLVAFLCHLQSLSSHSYMASQCGSQSFGARPQWLPQPQGFSQQPIPSCSLVPQVLSTGVPTHLYNAPLHSAPTQSSPLQLSAAVAGFSSGLPAAATVAAALSSAAHGIQVPKRQQLHDHSDVPCQEEFGQIDFGLVEAIVDSGHLAKPRSMASENRDRRHTSCAPILSPDVSPNHIGEESYALVLESDIDCHDRNSHAKNGRLFACKFLFVGIDLDRDEGFELVPRLIGRGGENMRQIAHHCNGKVRIRGRGSGHKEQQNGSKIAKEADVPLQIALSCKDRRSFEEGRQLLVDFLERMCTHFERYCKRHRIQPVPTLYTIVGDP